MELTQTLPSVDIASQRKQKQQKNTRIMQQFQAEVYQKLEDRFNQPMTTDDLHTDSLGSQLWDDQIKLAQELNAEEYFQRFAEDEDIFRISASTDKQQQQQQQQQQPNVLLIKVNKSDEHTKPVHETNKEQTEPVSFGKMVYETHLSKTSNPNAISLPRLDVNVNTQRKSISKVAANPPGGRGAREGGQPDVRTEERKKVEDKSMAGLIMGDLSNGWSPRDLTLALCIHSAMTDTEVERSWLIEKVYPVLKDWARTRGLNLQVLDSQWGMRDAALDGAELRHLSAASVTDRQGLRNIFVITMMSQKYGEPTLPLTINRQDFHAIRDSVERMSATAEPTDTNSIPGAEDPHSRSRKSSQIVMGREDRRAIQERRLSRYRKPSVGSQMIKLAVEQRARRVSRVSNKSDLLRLDEDTDGKSTEGKYLEGISTEGKSTEGKSTEGKTTERKSSVGLTLHQRLGERGIAGSRGQASSSLSTSKTPSIAPPEATGVVKDSVHLLTSWYRLDENNDPPVYRLQDISKHYPEIWSRAASERASCKSQWRIVARKLNKMILDGSREAQLDPTSVHKLSTSAAELEYDGLFSEVEGGGASVEVGGVMWLRRELNSELFELREELCRDYLDLLPLQQALDKSAQHRLQLFTRGKLQQHFQKEVQKHYSVEWIPQGIDPSLSRTHRLYIEQMSDDVTQTIMKHVKNELRKEQETRSEELLQLAAEIHQHVTTARKLSQNFCGREGQLNSIIRYTDRSRDHGTCGPLLLIGSTPGCGLTSLMAKAALMTSQRHRDAVVIVRFIDLTLQSTDLRHLLRNICQQLDSAYQSLTNHASHCQQLPNNTNGLMNYFTRSLERASAQLPLYIFIDSLHKLTDNYNSKQLHWLPRNLPAHVSIIVSSLESDATAKAFRNPSRSVASTLENAEQEQIVKVDELPGRSWEIVLNKSLRDHNRKINKSQRDTLLRAFERSNSSIFSSLLIKDALHWSSYEQLHSTSLGDTLHALVTHRFSRAERIHGEALVRRTLGYITAACVEVKPPEDDQLRGGGGQRSKGLQVGGPGGGEDGLGRVMVAGERHGLTFNELEDLLSMDEAVVTEVAEYCRLPLRRVPSMLLARLLFDLRHYLRYSLDVTNYSGAWRDLLISKTIGPSTTNRLLAGQGHLITWAHSEIQLIASERYLDQRDKAISYHKLMAEYFLDSNQKSAVSDKASEHRASRHVMSQPLYWDVTIQHVGMTTGSVARNKSVTYSHTAKKDGSSSCGGAMEQETVSYRMDNNSEGKDDAWNYGTQRVYNTRALTQLPAQLALLHKLDQLKGACLCNLEFLLAKLTATSVDSLLKDVQLGLKIDPRDGDLILLTSFLEESRNVLECDPSQLASQLMGRLRKIIDEDVPLAPRDPIKYPFMKVLFRQIKQSSVPILIPSGTCLLEPIGLSCDVLSDHTRPITAIASSSDSSVAVTTSLDDTMKLWCLATGRVLNTIHGVGRRVLEVQFCRGNSLVVTSESDSLRLWDTERWICIQRLSEVSDPAVIGTACEGQYLIALFHGSFILKMWDLNEPTSAQPIITEQPEELLQSADQALLSKNSFNSLLLFGAKNTNRALIYNYGKREIVRRLRVRQMEGSIRALAASVDYFIMAVRYPCAKTYDAINIELFDGRTFDFVRALKGCVGNDIIYSLHINERGSHALSFCCSPSSGVSYVASWGLDTAEHKHIVKHRGTSLLGSVQDFRYILTASSEECCFRRWNAKMILTKKSPKEKPTSGILQLFSLRDYPRYVAALSTNERELSVWNLTKNKKRGQQIYVERNLSQPGDVVLVNGTLVVVLSRKVFDVVGDRQQAVYRTLKQYNIMERKFTTIVESCAVIQSQRDEYQLLNDNLLLGLSETRSHVIVYSIETGQAMHQLRHSFRDAMHSRQDYVLTGLTRRVTSGVKVDSSVDTGSMLTPWARRLETQTAKGRRQKALVEEERLAERELKLEKSNSIEKFLLSEDQSTLVASYFAHHLCVFDVPQQRHVTTLERSNSILNLYAAALTSDGKYLAQSIFDVVEKIGYVTVWNCRTGKTRRRLRNQTSVTVVAISDDARRVIYGKQPAVNSDVNDMKQISQASICIWNISRDGDTSCVFRELRSHQRLDFTPSSSIRLTDGATRAVVIGVDVSLWDVEHGILLSVFTPDGFISAHTLALDDRCIVLSLPDCAQPVSLRSVEPGKVGAAPAGRNIFEEEDSDDDDSDDDEDDDESIAEN